MLSEGKTTIKVWCHSILGENSREFPETRLVRWSARRVYELKARQDEFL